MKTSPFAYMNELGRRFASTTENQQGFPCGPADQSLFNGMFYRIEAELGHVIDYAGITGTDTDLTQLRQAIQAIILASLAGLEDTGGEIDTSQFLLIGQARVRLPIYPEIMNTAGVMGIISPAPGTIRVPAGVTFQHRGIFPINTVQVDLPTVASKTYHLRWNPTDGFTLRDLADVGYNPTVASETSATFDTQYDDMLVARVITNGANIATITNLINKPDLALQTLIPGTNVTAVNADVTKADCVSVYNWSRTPKSFSLDIAMSRGSKQDKVWIHRNTCLLGASNSELMNGPPIFAVDRYRVAQTIASTYFTAITYNFSAVS